MTTNNPVNDILLARATKAVEQAGERLLIRYRAQPAPTTLADLLSGINANDAAVEGELREALVLAQPNSQWASDEEEEGALPPGDWWVADPAEGNVNLLHGRPGWGVTAALVRDGEPVLTVIHVPLAAETYTAIAGRGAFLNGRRLRVSAKHELDAALVSSGQARPGESEEVRLAMLRSTKALLDAALLVRLSVPSALELVDVASGRLDAFWQHGSVRAGLVGGALLVRESGGLVTDIAGTPWTAGSASFLASPPALQPALLHVFSSTSEYNA